MASIKSWAFLGLQNYTKPAPNSHQLTLHRFLSITILTNACIVLWLPLDLFLALWPWPLTFWPPKSIVSCSSPMDNSCQLPSKLVQNIMFASLVDGQMNREIEYITPWWLASLAWQVTWTQLYPFNHAHYYLCICQPNTLHSPGDIKVQKLLLENAISNMGEYHIELLTDNKVVELSWNQ